MREGVGRPYHHLAYMLYAGACVLHPFPWIWLEKDEVRRPEVYLEQKIHGQLLALHVVPVELGRCVPPAVDRGGLARCECDLGSHCRVRELALRI